MNDFYARQHRYFNDSAGVQEAAEAISAQSFADFFHDYVAGVKPIPYNDFFRFVGLQLAIKMSPSRIPAFSLQPTSTANQPSP